MEGLTHTTSLQGGTDLILAQLLDCACAKIKGQPTYIMAANAFVSMHGRAVSFLHREYCSILPARGGGGTKQPAVLHSLLSSVHVICNQSLVSQD